MDLQLTNKTVLVTGAGWVGRDVALVTRPVGSRPVTRPGLDCRRSCQAPPTRVVAARQRRHAAAAPPARVAGGLGADGAAARLALSSWTTGQIISVNGGYAMP